MANARRGVGYMVGCLALLGLPACHRDSSRVYYTYQRQSDEVWGAARPITLSLLAKQAHRPLHIELGLCYDNRTTLLSLPLELRLRRGDQLLCTDTIHLRLAKQMGRWSDAQVSTHEVTASLPPFSPPLSGIYTLECAPMGIEATGVVGLGIQVQ